MKISLTNRTILLAVMLVIGALLTMALLTSFSVRQMLQDEIVTQLEREASSFLRLVEKNRFDGRLIEKEHLKRSLQNEFLELKRTSTSNCAIFVDDSQSFAPYYFYKPDSLPAEVLRNLHYQTAKTQRFYEFEKQGVAYYCVVRPVHDVLFQTRVLPGAVLTYTSADAMLQFNASLLQTLLLSAAIGSVIAIAGGYWAARRIAAPLILLQQQADRFAARQFDASSIAIETGDEIEALSHSLDTMGARIREHDTKQREFFQNLSHELKTPLMSIQGYAEGLRDGLFDDRDAALDIIIRESQQIKRQIEDITYLLKMDMLESFFTLKPTGMNALLAEAIRRIEGIALQRDIDILYEPGADLELSVDGEKIVTVLTNVLTNCLKYGKHQIRVAATREDQLFIISIRDDGDGFSESDLQHIFDRFYKGKQAGTGLGMAISREIMRRHQGEIEVMNTPEGGAAFKLTLPCSNAVPTAAPS